MADLSVGSKDVHEEGVEINGIESFGGVIKNGIVDVINCHCAQVAHDVKDYLVCVPCLACGGVDGTQFLAFGCRGVGWDSWVSWRFNLWDVECLSIASQVDGWILKLAKVSLDVSQWTRNFHEVSGQFADNHLDLFMGGFPKDTCEDGMRHLGLNALGTHGIERHCLGGTDGSTKGRCLVGSIVNANDANEKCTRSSVPVFGVCGNVGNGYTVDDGDGYLNG